MKRTLRPPAAATVAPISAGCSNAAAETGAGSSGGHGGSKNAADWSGIAPPRTPVLLSDPRVSAVPVRENGEPLVELDESFGPTRARVRLSLAGRLVVARESLPPGVGLRVVEGYRTAAAQRAIISSYTARLRERHPTIGAAELARLASRFVAPLAVAPHVSGAAVDVTLVDSAGRDLDLGTPIDATPEESRGACYFDAPQVRGQARANRHLLARVLSGAGLVNYPTEWWHWSYGDRYWALMTGAPAALYGPAGRRSRRR